MALVACHECSAQISTDAAKCPQCGASTPRGSSRFAWFVGVTMLLLVVAGCYALYFNSDSAVEDRRGQQALENFKHSDEAVLARYGPLLRIDSGLAAHVLSTTDSSTVVPCQHLAHLETQGDLMDRSQGTREIRLRAEAQQRQANVVLMTTPAGWDRRVRGEIYHCRPGEGPPR